MAKLDLNGLGANYVNYRLASGGIISRSILQRIGKIDNAYSPLPCDIGLDQALQFNRGGTTSLRATVQWVVSNVLIKLPNGSDFCFLIEDLWAKPADLSMHQESNAVFLMGESIVYGISRDNFTPIGVAQLLRNISSFDYNAFLVSRDLPSTREISIGEVEFIAKFARLVAVSAFDREGLVISEMTERVSGFSHCAIP